MQRTILSFLFLAGVGLALLAGSLVTAGGWVFYPLGAIGLFFCLALVLHILDLKKKPGAVKGDKLLPILATGVIGAAATWALRMALGLDACVASGLVGIVAALVLPGNLAAVAYAASFAGMSSQAVLTGLPMVLCAGILAGGIYFLVLPVYEGVGGKLGTIAAGSVLAATLIFRFFGGM
ncbi:MAG: hypothetical protein ACOX2G_06945 [Bacillota bacterium]